MSTTPSNQLVCFTRSDYERLKEALRDLHDVVLLCDKGEACGLDVSYYRRLKDELSDILLRIEAEFMSPPPKE